ncbi:MAG: T9SS type A sorting domain-containing protein, partial [bacterium]|nr:T9SS type A sorting domain-containing protein [bacterium]
SPGFHHSGYPTADGKHLFITNELAEHPTADITVWNIEDLSSPYQVASIAEPSATVHNLYIIDDYAYVSYYTLGFHVYDVSDPTNPCLADSHDTSALTGDGFDGAFGVYPFAPSGTIYVSDRQRGLFVFSFTPGQITAVLIQRFDARVVDGVVMLTWTISEADGLQGFHIYRSESRDGGFIRITNELLSPDRAYTYRDDNIEAGRTYYYRLGAVDRDGEFSSPLRRVSIPAAPFSLFQNFPNPFNPVTTITFDLETEGHIRLAVYDALGAKIRTLAEGAYSAGPHSVGWDATDQGHARVASGTYFYRLEAGGGVLTRRMVLLK